jgi:hypothetical protein
MGVDNMCCFLFEDNENTPSSKLLKKSYNGKNIFFSAGCANLRKSIDDLINKGYHKIVAFVDVSPNNKNTIELYNFLSKVKSTTSSWKNVIIVPIICIEFYIAELCKCYGYFEPEQLQRNTIKNLVCDFNWDAMPTSDKKYSLEKIYKWLFEDKVENQECLKNKNGKGIFYLQDCNCDNCTLSKSTLSEKAEQLYCKLPIFDVLEDTEHENKLKRLGINYNNISLDELHKKQQDFYDNICNKLNENKFLICTI